MLKMLQVLFAFVVIICEAQGSENGVSVALDTYQQKVRAQATGVYEIGSNLYVHVRLPMSVRDNKAKLVLNATLRCKDILREWAIAYASRNQCPGDSVAEGIALAVDLLNSYGRLWRYMDWEVKSMGQEVSGKDGKEFFMGWIVDRNVLISKIPEVYYKSIPDAAYVLEKLSCLVPAMARKDSVRLYNACGAVDLDRLGVTNVEATVEWKTATEVVNGYLRDHPFAREVADQMATLLSPVTAVELSELQPDGGSDSTVVLSSVTNVVSTSVSTSIVERAETSEERMKRGISSSVKMIEESRISDIEEIIETKTLTTRRRIRRKTERMVRGRPRFEEIYLSGGIATNAPTPQLESAVTASRLYRGSGATMEARERALRDALCENPGDVQMWNMFGRCRMALGDLAGALICFRAAVKLDSNDGYALTNLAEAYEGLGCHRLACGYAVLVIGVIKDDWCIDKCKRILMK